MPANNPVEMSLFGKTADEIRAQINAFKSPADRKVAEGIVVAYLQAKDALKAPSKRLLAELTGESPASTTAEPTAEPTVKAPAKKAAKPVVEDPLEDAPSDDEAFDQIIARLEEVEETNGHLITHVKTLDAQMVRLTSMLEKLIERTSPAATLIAVVPEPLPAPRAHRGKAPEPERTVIDPSLVPEVIVPDPTRVTRGGVTKPVAEKVKVISLGEAARQAAEDVKF